MAQPDPFGLVGLTYDDVLLLPGESDVEHKSHVTVGDNAKQ